MKRLVGEEINESPEIKTLISKLVETVNRDNSEIVGVRGPDPERQAKNENQIKVVNAIRGRPLYYPYIGTGAGHGPYVELEDGSVKLDLINGIGIHILGHSHPVVLEASVRGALSDVVMQGNLQPNKEYFRLAEKLVQLAKKKSRLAHVWLSTCGSVANENALKICRQKKTPARKIIAMKGAFAGRTTLMAEITDNASFRVGLPEYNEVLRVPFYDHKNPRSTELALQELKRHIAENPGNISCFIFEPMQGEGGYYVAPREYFVPLLEYCKEKGVPVWDDEVQTFCRTGEFFAYETLDLGKYIDVCTIAKTVQCGATLYTEEYNPQPGLIAGTFSGGSAAISAGFSLVDHLDKGGYMGANGKVNAINKEFVKMLNDLATTTCKGLISEAGGLGLMIAFTPFDGSKEKQGELLKTFFKNGMISFGCGHGPYRVRFLVPAIVTSKDIQVAKGIIEKSLLELA